MSRCIDRSMAEPGREFQYPGVDGDRDILSPESLAFVFRRPIELPCRRISVAKVRLAIERGLPPNVAYQLLCSDPGLLCRFVRNFAKFDNKTATFSFEFDEIISEIEHWQWRAFFSSMMLTDHAVSDMVSPRFEPRLLSRHCRFMAYGAFEFALDVMVGFTPYQAAAFACLHHLPSLILHNSAFPTYKWVADIAALDQITLEAAFERLYSVPLRAHGEWITKAWRLEEGANTAWHAPDDESQFTLIGSAIRVLDWMARNHDMQWEPWPVNTTLAKADETTWNEHRSTFQRILRDFRLGVKPAG